MKNNIHRRLLLPAIVALILAAFVGFMAGNASLLHVMRASVWMPDLPPAFEGLKILYVTDVDLCGWNTPERAADAVMRLQSLQPDVLILGGDYTSPTLSELLNRQTNAQRMLSQRSEFLQAIGGFSAPMGKFAFISREDAALGDMTGILNQQGFAILNDARSRLAVGDDALWLVGVADAGKAAGYGGAFRSGECVVCVAESPDSFPRIITAEARDGGPWADLCLAGRTHGGQIRLLGRSALTLTDIEQQFISGWTRVTNVPMLTSSGLGCEGANLRLGSRAEVWLVTLTTVKP